jgi:hypothetical protein
MPAINYSSITLLHGWHHMLYKTGAMINGSMEVSFKTTILAPCGDHIG